MVKPKEEEAEAAYQAALAAAMQTSIEEEPRKEEEKETASQARLAEAPALSAAGDCVVLPSPTRLQPPTPKAESAPTERYVWTGGLREWVSGPLRVAWHNTDVGGGVPRTMVPATASRGAPPR